MFLGEMSEWFKVQLSKSCVLHSTVGSNPTLSASSPQAPERLRRVFYAPRQKRVLGLFPLRFRTGPASSCGALRDLKSFITLRYQQEENRTGLAKHTVLPALCFENMDYGLSDCSCPDNGALRENSGCEPG